MTDQITHVIFDLDGTILNTIDVAIDILNDYAKSLGKQCPKDIRYLIENSSDFVIFDEYCDAIGLSKDVDRNVFSKQLFQKIISKGFPLIPGVNRLIKHLHKNNIPMAIASATSEKSIETLKKNLKNYFETYFSHIVFGLDDNEIKNNKPNPEIYYVCAKRFQTKPKSMENILIIEDSLKGITGAVASDMKTLLINDRKKCNFDAIADKITLIVDSFNDFKPESIGLPPYEN